jgi:hypothetical protein
MRLPLEDVILAFISTLAPNFCSLNKQLASLYSALARYEPREQIYRFCTIWQANIHLL